MDKEEKRIINYLKREVKEPLQGLENEEDTSILINIKDCKCLLKFIKKQQKEIERIKNFNYNTYIRKDTIRHIRDKAECMDYYSLNDVIDDLSKLLGEINK